MYTSATCTPCKSLKPILQKVCEEKGIHMELIDGDTVDPTQLCIMNVRSYPTVFVKSGGQVLNRFSGAKNRAWIEEFLED